MEKKTRCLIIGSGPAGYTAAIYAARADLSPLLYTGIQAGGQLTTTTDVDNFPGYPKGVMGPKMMEDLKEQAERFGTKVVLETIEKVIPSKAGKPHKAIASQEEILADSIIIATGASAKYLGLESEQRLLGKGVSACAICDGFFFKGQDVAIVGGGDTAAEEASYLSKICKSVQMFIRKDHMKASKAMQHRVENTPNIHIHYNTEVKDILGEKEVCGVKVINNQTQKETEFVVQAFFSAIGHSPNTSLFTTFLDMDPAGYILTKGKSTKTNVAGIFASGDVQDKEYRQAITAAGSGCMAALDAERYLSTL